MEQSILPFTWADIIRDHCEVRRRAGPPIVVSERDDSTLCGSESTRDERYSAGVYSLTSLRVSSLRELNRQKGDYRG
jgi:hypothetical protein